ncbi:MAG: class 1b ribonucleoside-diphosphate reductase subunit beta [Paenibacillus macerans]|uniref:Ribonucleoside-diphosphate reductase subunit beta n=1 Tax=Paenibacillus macerans TaxID=44252 RepID=A0A090ZJP7_PAEMA|nr:class 1b ribonucleoside-diphosphate reductase subunit beta [Paenibacillus macerans]KFN10588.1 ribonucleotide reductase, small chain family protein [Paenibacillus macerans]MBS5909270.1 class 1b ribonucleoside-diphosphate reductase subunit beta [Paenibacillus macerans]MCY7556938.1 class 1b ribonucleoside-diphosphate reductase subunit beta [Paenibacillus macerans]MDU5946413.1 class 1b ribonucleoside-diphosphate reductase subunit beta [Paenibacillus macerans]MDU7476401.1 class 1b ribonucleoside
MCALRAVNWNRPDDDFTMMFWNQNIMQFWTDDEIPLSDDKMSWMTLNDDEKDAYMKVLGGLTLLDTVQGGVGMPQIMEHVEGLQRKAVLGFMGMMEQIHAKSYSSIFTTLASNEEIDEIFRWVEQNPMLQTKAETIRQYYTNIRSPRELYLAMAASVLLESYLFYSGFFYPLYLAGQGKMTCSGEIIDLILRDESIHGVYVGVLAQEIYAQMSEDEQKDVYETLEGLLHYLHANEERYTEQIYTKIGLVDEVKVFLRYNANKAFMNLGFEPPFEEEEVNPIVFNGIRTDTKQHDFFSKKGNGYVRALNVEPLTDEDFNF